MCPTVALSHSVDAVTSSAPCGVGQHGGRAPCFQVGSGGLRRPGPHNPLLKRGLTMICQHCGHSTDQHERWGGDRDTRDVLAEVARLCHDCTHPVCELVHQLAHRRPAV